MEHSHTAWVRLTLTWSEHVFFHRHIYGIYLSAFRPYGYCIKDYNASDLIVMTFLFGTTINQRVWSHPADPLITV
jgi:hypothetical protein